MRHFAKPYLPNCHGLYLIVLLGISLIAYPSVSHAAIGTPVATGELMPVPSSLKWMEKDFVTIGGRLPVAISGGNLHRLERALERWRRGLVAETGMDAALVSSDTPSATLHIQVQESGEQYPDGSGDESYSLSVSAEHIQIAAQTTYGALHGLQTLRQLARQCDGQLCFSAVDIDDRPRFAVRGLMIDVVRHWMPVDTIKRQLDGMEAVKLNYLQLHLSDDQGFRVESFKLPRLHEYGSDGNYYRQADIREIVDYAADRGIRIVPEFDLPGHSRSWQIAYPSLSSRPGKSYQLYRTDSMFSDPIDPTREDVYRLLTTLVEEMTPLFPDPYFHIGGDEVNFDAWEANEEIDTFVKNQGLSNSHALQTYFVNRYADIVEHANRTPVAWADVLDGEVADSLIVHHWYEIEVPGSAAKHQSLVSVNYYLDHMRSAEFHYRNDPLNLTVKGAPNMQARDNVVGVVAAAWSEIMDSRNIDQCLWPRSAAIAERLWSAVEFTNNADIDDVYRRMEATSDYLKSLGFRHGTAQQQELQALAGRGNAAALQTLANLLEPVPFYAFRNWNTVGMMVAPWFFVSDLPDEPFQTAAFTGVLSSESLTAWHFNRDVARYLADPHNASLENSLLDRLGNWSRLHQQLRDTNQFSPALQDQGIARLSESVSTLAGIGIRALEGHKDGSKFTQKEVANQLAYVSSYASPPLAYSADYLWMSFKKMFQPPEMRNHAIAIQPGTRMLVEALLQKSQGNSP